MITELGLRNVFGPFAGRYIGVIKTNDGLSVDENHHNVSNLRESAADQGLRVHFNLPGQKTPVDHDPARAQVTVVSDNNGGYYIGYKDQGGVKLG